MPTKSVVVGSSVGLHARPAQLIAQAAEELDVEVLIGIPGGDPVDASSSLMIMTLGAGPGDTVEVSSDDESALETIAAMVEKDLDA
ncbi:HPr family phosphocarrier protein [Nocardioides sp.]|uniref:HPr family phosphocarrier protein n=1 Tax=Nocardioides sp. TaxID=35761 RepID=UPI002ED7B731